MTDAAWSLEAIGYDAHFATRLAALGGALVPARIAIAHGESSIAWTARGTCKAVLVNRLDRWREAINRPQVGDWVAGTTAEPGDVLMVEHLLERRTCLMRQASGGRGVAQVIAANVDVVGIVSAFGEIKGAQARGGRLINEAQLERYLTAVEQSLAQPLLIVNKSDLSADPAAVEEVLGRRFPGVPVVLTSAKGAQDLEGLAPFLTPGRTLGLVGLSGVGKSTLVNALVGRAAQRTGEVRESDARGRHTTTHRELIAMENGALLIDTPGMRELGVWEPESLVGFEDVIGLAANCRFGNCRHAREPGCAIHAALAAGGLSSERWASYQRQQQKIAGSPHHPRRR
jgi:ribosome biogenesis GTPase / thiamine phosphate phosphatase